MKHKTLFRLVMKALGVFFTLWAAPSLIKTLLNYGSTFGSTGWAAWSASYAWTIARDLAPYVLQLAAGLYLFFGGEWVVNRCIPSNRPYCPNCGYDLAKAQGPRCPECGVAIPKNELDIVN